MSRIHSFRNTHYPQVVAQDLGELTADEVYEVSLGRCPDCGGSLFGMSYIACENIGFCGAGFRAVPSLWSSSAYRQTYIPKFRVRWPKDITLAALNKANNSHPQQSLGM